MPCKTIDQVELPVAEPQVVGNRSIRFVTHYLYMGSHR
jgi:hypothetical protein